MTDAQSQELEFCLAELQKRLGYTFKNPDLLRLAFRLRDGSDTDPAMNNQRLEYLGDAALELVVSEQLYGAYAHAGEGFMTIERSKLICGQNLSVWGYEAGFDRMLYGRSTENITADDVEDAVEAVIGALYLDGGLDAVRAFLRSCEDYPDCGGGFEPLRHLERICVNESLGAVSCAAVMTCGPNGTVYLAQIRVDGREVGAGRGRTRESAERAAAWGALKQLSGVSELDSHRRSGLMANRILHLQSLSARARRIAQSLPVTVSRPAAPAVSVPVSVPSPVEPVSNTVVPAASESTPAVSAKPVGAEPLTAPLRDVFTAASAPSDAPAHVAAESADSASVVSAAPVSVSIPAAAEPLPTTVPVSSADSVPAAGESAPSAVSVPAAESAPSETPAAEPTPSAAPETAEPLPAASSAPDEPQTLELLSPAESDAPDSDEGIRLDAKGIDENSLTIDDLLKQPVIARKRGVEFRVLPVEGAGCHVGIFRGRALDAAAEGEARSVALTAAQRMAFNRARPTLKEVFKNYDLRDLSADPALKGDLQSRIARRWLGLPRYIPLGGGESFAVAARLNGITVAVGHGIDERAASQQAAWMTMQLFAAGSCGLATALNIDAAPLAARFRAAVLDILKKDSVEPQMVTRFESTRTARATCFGGGLKPVLEARALDTSDARTLALIRTVSACELWTPVCAALGLPDGSGTPIERLAAAIPNVKRGALPDGLIDDYSFVHIGLFVGGTLAACMETIDPEPAWQWLALLLLVRAAEKRPLSAPDTFVMSDDDAGGAPDSPAAGTNAASAAPKSASESLMSLRGSFASACASRGLSSPVWRSDGDGDGVELYIGGTLVLTVTGSDAKLRAARRAAALFDDLGASDAPALISHLAEAARTALGREGLTVSASAVDGGLSEGVVADAGKELCRVTALNHLDACVLALVKTITDARAWRAVYDELGILRLCALASNFRPDFTLAECVKPAPDSVFVEVGSTARTILYRTVMFVGDEPAAAVTAPNKKTAEQWLALLLLDRLARGESLLPPVPSPEPAEPKDPTGENPAEASGQSAGDAGEPTEPNGENPNEEAESIGTVPPEAGELTDENPNEETPTNQSALNGENPTEPEASDAETASESNEPNDENPSAQTAPDVETPAAPGESNGEKPPHPAAEMVYVAPHGRKYHRAGCPFLGPDRAALTESAARARGCTPCARCQPKDSEITPHV